MILPLQKFSILMENMAAGVQGGAAQLLDLSVGSVLRALLEACAAVALWMQWLILQVLTMTRAATSTGSDLDSWMADFRLVRLPGAPSAGLLTMARYTSGVAATVPVGATVSTNDGTQGFQVIAQATNPAWNGSAGYSVSPLASFVSVPAQATTPGVTGNVQPGAIGRLTLAIPGIDTVTNLAAFAGGLDPENDAGLRSRFQLYINSRSLATSGAIQFAIATLQQGLRYVVLENQDTTGAPMPGHFWVIIDDGTGAPSDALISSASAAVEAVRPIGATYAVTGPSVEAVTVQITISTSSPLTKSAVMQAIGSAVSIWIAALPIAGTLAISKMEAIAHAVDPSVVSVLSATINGMATDVTASESGVLVASSVVVG